MSPLRLIPATLLERARSMRHDPTPAEEKLWNCLRDRQLAGYKFRRQRPIPPYIADFYCVKLQIVIELDGDTHADHTAYDARRTQHLERGGHHVIRFLNTDVSHHLEIVLEEIFKQCQQLDGLKSPSPQPSPGVPREGVQSC